MTDAIPPIPSHPAVAGTARADAERARLEGAAREFEGMFLAVMFRSALGGSEREDPLGPGGGGGPWRDMLWDAYGRAVARAGGIGLADAVLRQLIRASETR